MSDEEHEQQAGGAGGASPAPKTDSWERDVINRLAFAALAEQRRARRWGIFFKSILLLYVVVVLMLYLPERFGTGAISTGKHTALVDMDGVIATDMPAGSENVIEGLRAAFEDKHTAGVILRINSPGGSPVQASYINEEIRRLRKDHPSVHLYAVITDICASGGYYVAAAAERIYADKASIVGSIGVLMNGFGFVDTMHKLGIERRLLTAGEHKGMLDPFSPQRPEDVQHIQALLDEIHQQFIQVVKAGRGERLKDDPEIFSGLVWSGERGVELGLVDGLASSTQVARDVIGAEDVVDYTAHPDFLERISEQLGLSMARAFSSITSRSLLR